MALGDGAMMAAVRIFVWLVFWAVVVYLLCTGPYWPALVVAVVGIVILALAEIDQHLKGSRGWYKR
jgi:hypothetical protein